MCELIFAQAVRADCIVPSTHPAIPHRRLLRTLLTSLIIDHDYGFRICAHSRTPPVKKTNSRKYSLQPRSEQAPFVLGAYRALTHGGAGELAEGLHRVGLRLAQAHQTLIGLTSWGWSKLLIVR